MTTRALPESLLAALVHGREDLDRACAELLDALRRASGFDPDSGGDLSLSSGIAIGPAAAAQCILDPGRTVAFLRGVHRAIERGAREIVYAGTGPYAPLLIPLSTMLDADVRCTLIDIHPRNVDSVKTLVERFHISASVVCTDATQYEHHRPIDLIITETMQRALSVEPYVAIVRNLRRQLAPGGLLIPERVCIGAMLIDAQTERARWSDPAVAPQHEPLATIFEITAHHESADAVTITVPHRDGEQWLALSTHIDVFEGIEIANSGLTTPFILWPLSPARAGDVIEFRYEAAANPGVVWRRTRSA